MTDDCCPHDCLWSDHDANGICYRDCERCPDRCERPTVTQQPLFGDAK